MKMLSRRQFMASASVIAGITGIASKGAFACPGPFAIEPEAFSLWRGPTWPAIARGRSGAFDEGDCEGAFVHQENGLLYVYYTGWDASLTQACIGLAIGTRMGNLRKHGIVLYPGGGGGWDNAWVSGNVRVYNVDGTYYMYYSGSNNPSFEGGPSSLGLATATSPLGPFVKTGDPIVVGDPGSWDSYQLFMDEASWSWANGLFYLFYNGFDESRIEQMGLCVSDNPAGPWTKLGVVISNDWWSRNRVFCLTAIPNDMGGWLIMYCGQTDPNFSTFGLATAAADFSWISKYDGNPGAIQSSAGLVGRPAPFYNYNTGRWEALGDNVRDIYPLLCACQP